MNSGYVKVSAISCIGSQGLKIEISDRRLGFAFYDYAAGNPTISMADVYLHYTPLSARHVSSRSPRLFENIAQGKQSFVHRIFLIYNSSDRRRVGRRHRPTCDSAPT